MKAFRIVFLVVVCAAVAAFGAVATYNTLRLEGTSTPSSGSYLWISDHTDSFHTDTFTSDTLDVLQDEYVNVGAQLVTYTECDSCNDSIILIWQLLSSFNGTDPYVVHTDTFGTNGTLTDGEVLRWHFRSDTLLYNRLWNRIIVKDSITSDADSTADSTFINLIYHVVRRPYN